MNLSSLTQLTRTLRTFTYGDHIRPRRDWLLVLLIGGLVFIASASWNYWLFHTISAGESLQSAGGANTNLSIATLESVHAIFDMRAAERAHYQNDYRFVDPSR